MELEIAGRNYSIRQSPGLLKSDNAGGTTGAVLWKVTPLLAEWLAARPSLLTDINVLHSDATVVELGCGLTGLIGQVMSGTVKRYVLTDQASITKHLKANLDDEMATRQTTTSKYKKKNKPQSDRRSEVALQVCPLDWECDAVENLREALTSEGNIDLIVVCDCVYNEYLVNPLVQTCVDVCRLAQQKHHATLVLIAQQLRSDSIFHTFLCAMMLQFDVWRVGDEHIVMGLGTNSGYVVHVAVLKQSTDA